MIKKIDQHGECPECGFDFDDGLIWEAWRKQEYWKNKTDDELIQMAKNSYGKPYRFSKLLGIEVRGKYNGVSYWQCPSCKATWDRWTGELIKKDAILGKGEQK